MRPAGRSASGCLDLERFSLASGVVLFAALSFSGCQESSKEPQKKTYVLTVTRGEGVDGYPNPGTYAYNPGMEVNYGYRALEDYSDLVVTLDGEPIAATGSFIMNAKHTLAATCFKRVLWKYDVDSAVYYSSPAVGDDGTVYVGGDGLYAVDPLTGRRIWHHTHPDFASRECLASPVIGSDGTIYVTIGEDMLFAVNPDGRRRWIFRFAHDWEMSFTSPAIDQNGVIYLASEGNYGGTTLSNLYAVNPDGTLNWKFPLQHAVNWSFPAIANDGTIYLGTLRGGNYQGYLYAIKSTSMGYLPSAWPRFRHDRKNTGRFGAW